MRRKVCVVTGTRAEYGLLFWLLREIQSDPALTLQLVVTGMHLAPEFGLTVRDIESDGFVIDDRVETLLSSDTPVGMAKAIGLGVIGFADVFARARPDLLVVLGDRFEIFAAAQAAMIARIPIAHIHGGELTEGAVDDAMRHSITKMAHIHFVAAEPYRQRVIQLGEQPSRVYNVGAAAIDQIRRTNLLDRDEFERSTEFALGRPTFLVTYHPVTLSDRAPADGAAELLSALDRFPTARILFTAANADAGGRSINDLFMAYAGSQHERSRFVTSLGQRRYLSALRLVDVVIGNSSSGLIEAPVAGVPTVNIGPRQKGRLRSASVIDCDEDASAIAAAIKRAIAPEFRVSLEGMTLPYGAGDTAEQIISIVKTVELGDELVFKSFHDVGPQSAGRMQPSDPE